MLTVSVDVEAQEGLTWPRWRMLVAEVERLGFAGLYRSDHLARLGVPDEPGLDPIASFTYLADHTQRLRFGQLVAPLSFRDPVQLARQAIDLEELSGGRFVLGVGAGWMAREHDIFGYDLGDIPTRLARFEEGLEVLTRLLRGSGPETFEGRFYRLREAVLLPRPMRPGSVPILIGGNGPRRTLPLAARYADFWNATWLSPDNFRERSSRLDEALQAVGRWPGDVRRTAMVLAVCGRDSRELERRLEYMRRFMPTWADLSTDELVVAVGQRCRAIAGSPEHLAERFTAYEAAGGEELMVQWCDVDDIEGLRIIAEEVLPLLGP